MKNIKKLSIRILSLLMTLCLSAGIFYRDGGKSAGANGGASSANSETLFSQVNTLYKNDISGLLDTNTVYQLPEGISDNQDISVIVSMSTKTLVEDYVASGSNGKVSDYIKNNANGTTIAAADEERVSLIRALSASGVAYTLGESYDNVLSGFEITLKAKDFYKVNDLLLERNATAIVGEVYRPCETEVITNEVDIDEETGIFKNTLKDLKLEGFDDPIDGTGVVVAVLDTGLDYTHSAFDASRFTSKNKVLDRTKVGEKIRSGLNSASSSKGLKTEDVYVSDKVPYAYDYADKDTDVLPINSEHGTHVAGIIAGNDDVIQGVAPNAQLAIMKVFSDSSDGAKTSWLLAALEDCVNLGVDVINMSLGSGCGFSREVDKQNVAEIYDKVKAAGISLIASAANSYNATMGSEKNGNNGLTSNPDSGTVGSPSTYSAALSVASVDGVLTSYMLYKNEIIYFTEASTSDADVKKDFVDDILNKISEIKGTKIDSYDFEYVTIPGIGSAGDYSENDYEGKIVLVKRGTSTFEEKVRIALEQKNAAGIIIYNNVSGNISMSVGDNIGAVCSLSQDEGELLAAEKTGTIKISRDQKAGPFMSDFSSWGPTSDLKIKPEITAHGGEILSAVPGQGYERLSGTSMAAPNQAGATALIRQYVKYSGNFGTYGVDLDDITVTARVNQLMMSTADIIYNKNGLAYAVRKQGAGLINILKSATTATYIETYENGVEMDKSKLELGDDKNKTGVYTMTFGIKNFSNSEVAYDVNAITLTEGVSKTFTGHGDTTVTQNGYALGATTTVDKIENGSNSGNTVTVGAGKTAKVTVTVTLSSEAKKYLEESFEHGMYVEGFVTLTATKGTQVNVNVPYLSFYGDWTEAPIFDEEYYDTNKDEINNGIDANDKVMADAYATRVIGGLYSDYIATLGGYFFKQNPSDTQIAANKQHIAISNQKSEDGKSNYTVSSIRSISAGLLRNAKKIYITATDDSTGKVVWSKEINNQMKSFSSGSTIYASSIDVEFDALEQNLKNNTQYNFEVTAYIDYGTEEEQNNVRNTFEFPVYVDFEAPIVSNVEYRTEYDKNTKKTKVFADLYIYDNHYTMGVQVGEITESKDPAYRFAMDTFGNYVTPVYSDFNSTSKVSIELTDYVAKIKKSRGLTHDENGNLIVAENTNSFIAVCYDYAMNNATYEIKLPDEILGLYFEEDDIYLNRYETKMLSDILHVYPEESWLEVLDFESSDPSKVDVVNYALIAKDFITEGEYVTITAKGLDKNGAVHEARLNVHVYNEGEEGYEEYSVPMVSNFTITGYNTTKAFYSLNSDEREIGLTDSRNEFENGNKTLSMYPSECVELVYKLDKYFDEYTDVRFESGDESIAKIDEKTGVLTAVAEGDVFVSAIVTSLNRETGEWEDTYIQESVFVKVKNPFAFQAIYLMSYRGAGENIVDENGDIIATNVVTIPDDKGITTIYAYAFSGSEYVDKDLENGDVIDEEDPYYIKQQYIGDDTIKKVIIPEGVTTIEKYAFANLTALEEVVLPSTLTKIGVGAFYGCEKLNKVSFSGENNLKFINKDAFKMPLKDGEINSKLTSFDFSGAVAIGDYAFANCPLTNISLPASCMSIGIGSFSGCEKLRTVEFYSEKVKLGSTVFAGCTNLTEMTVNAEVIPSYAFTSCTSLKTINLGKDVKVINEFAFAGCAKLEKINVNSENKEFVAEGAFLYNSDKTQLIVVAPNYSGEKNVVTLPDSVKTISVGAFSGTQAIFKVIANSVEQIENYAFAQSKVETIICGEALNTIGDYTFAYCTNLVNAPNLSTVKSIGNYAFAATALTNVEISNDTTVGDYAFANCGKIQNVTIGDNVSLGKGSFFFNMSIKSFEYTGTISGTYYKEYDYSFNGQKYNYRQYDTANNTNSSLTSLTVGNNVVLGERAFAGNALLNSLTLGDNAKIGGYAFFNATSLKNVDLSKAVEIGEYAFSGTRLFVLSIKENEASLALRYDTVNSETVTVDYLFTSLAPSFESVDLSSASKLGKGAFENVITLKSVTLAENLSAQLSVDKDGNLISDQWTENALSPYAFDGCVNLTEINIPASVTTIGDYALSRTGLKQIVLTGVQQIGAYAFSTTALEKVTLSSGNVYAYDGAFGGAYKLSEINSENICYFGAQSFVGTALTKANVTCAVYIGDFAFAQSAVTEVIFGDEAVLVELGENPFYGCDITAFGKTQQVENFNGITVTNNTCTISETVFVEDGVLYQITPNGGYELVSYPALKQDTSYIVKEGTIRISARAFENCKLGSVTIASTVKSIGDKAFYECDNLNTVIFTSIAAPYLEEEYDSNYASQNNIPFSGYYYGSMGLGISKYYIWNIDSHKNNFYYGANFVNYVGKVDRYITMVKPANGNNYDSFIFAQYFKTIVSGAYAPTENTKNVIALIDALPEYIRLSDEEAVLAARKAYDDLGLASQQSLVSNYEKLTSAEATLEYLKYNNKSDDSSSSDSTINQNSNQATLVIIIILAVLLVAGVAALLYFLVFSKKGKANKNN